MDVHFILLKIRKENVEIHKMWILQMLHLGPAIVQKCDETMREKRKKKKTQTKKEEKEDMMSN